MSLQQLVHRYVTFNTWANHSMVAWLRQIDPILMTKHTPSSYPTLDSTVQHILRAEKFWNLFIMEQDFSHLDWKVQQGHDIYQMLDALAAQSRLLENNVKHLSEEDLLKPLHLNMPWAKNTQSRYEYILHIVNHGTFHRGQLVTMARCLGITEHIPATDYNIFNSEQP